MSSEKKDEHQENDNRLNSVAKPSTEKVRTVTEEEVEEFFKILRRVHVATRTFAKVNGGVADRSLPSLKRKRSKSLGLRISLDTDGVCNGVYEEITRVGLKGLGLDLNAKPGTDGFGL